MERCRSTKIEQILIPIYTYSLFKYLYEDSSPYKFLPAIGQQIQETTVCSRANLKDNKQPLFRLKTLNITDFTKVVNNKDTFNIIPINSRIPNGTVVDIKIHTIDKSKHHNILDRTLDNILQEMSNQNLSKVRSIADELKLMGFSDEERKEIIVRYYYLHNKLEASNYDIPQLVYLIELTISGDSGSDWGDKFVNR